MNCANMESVGLVGHGTHRVKVHKRFEFVRNAKERKYFEKYLPK